MSVEDQCSPPSRCTAVYWHIAQVPFKYNYSASLVKLEVEPCKIGKFLIFELRQYIDESWKRIEKATVDGKLGFASKVSTRKKKSADIGFKDGEGVICVYVKNSDNEVEKERIRDNLYRIGYSEYLPYKTDEDTAKGIYSQKHCGGKRMTETESDDSEPVTKKRPLPSNEDRPGSSKVVKVKTVEESQNAVIKNEKTEPSNSTQDSNDGVGHHSSEAVKKIPDSPSTGESIVRQRKIYPRQVNWRSIQYIKSYITTTPYRGERFGHIQQIYPPKAYGKNLDILFPLDQMKSIVNSIYQLGRTFVEDGEIVRGLETSHVKLSVEYSTELEAIAVKCQSTKNNVTISFPQTDFLFCLKNLEYVRKREVYNDPNRQDHGILTDEEVEDDNGDESDGSEYELELF